MPFFCNMHFTSPGYFKFLEEGIIGTNTFLTFLVQSFTVLSSWCQVISNVESYIFLRSSI
jgi:hypothetical protein